MIMKKFPVVFLVLCCTLGNFSACSDPSRFETASKLADKGDYAGAVSYLEDKHTERNHKYYGLHGLYCSKLAIPRYRDAVHDYETLLTLGYENNYYALCELALWSYCIEEFDKAVFYGKQAEFFSEQKENQLITFVMAESYYGMGDYDGSLELYRQLAEGNDASLSDALDYNKVLSIVHGDDSLLKFWEGLDLDGLSQEERDDLCFEYAKALLELGRFCEAQDCLDKLGTSSKQSVLMPPYKSFVSFIVSGIPSSGEQPLYMDTVEKMLKGSLVVFTSVPDLELLRLSTLYFYFKQDYARAGVYCSLLKNFSMDIRSQKKILDKAEIEQYFAHDRLYLMVKEYMDAAVGLGTK